jgi:hypothetical protein
VAVIIGETVSYQSATDSRDSVLLAEGVTYPSATDTRGSVGTAEVVEYAATSLYSVPGQTVLQKVWDTVAGNWVLWETEAIDSDGGSYPGPGTWGVHTSDFRLQNIKFTRV